VDLNSERYFVDMETRNDEAEELTNVFDVVALGKSAREATSS
jgi:hypothetical protein